MGATRADGSSTRAGYSGTSTPPFVQPTSPDDRRSLIPSEGLREYWYPALPAKDVGRKKPVALRLLNEELVLFKDKNGEVQALWDYCPHRGVYLSFGDCFFEGYLSCPYHGATFDGDGECVEFITEGPDSKMVGRLRARKFPTITLKELSSSGWVKANRCRRRRTSRPSSSRARRRRSGRPTATGTATG